MAETATFSMYVRACLGCVLYCAHVRQCNICCVSLACLDWLLLQVPTPLQDHCTCLPVSGDTQMAGTPATGHDFQIFGTESAIMNVTSGTPRERSRTVITDVSY